MKRYVGVAILGLGTVGGGTYEILTKNRERMAKVQGIDLEVVSVLERNQDVIKALGVPSEIVANDIMEVVSNDSVDIVVEVIGGVGIAKEFVKTALCAGKTVVTANKELIAKEFECLNKLAKDNKAGLYYEASCVGGTPVIRTLIDGMQGNNIQSLQGIVNGTTNYILTKMTEEGSSYEDALKVAQELGYAEADPTSDVDGYDAVYKLSILSSIAFAGKMELDKIYREGIRNVKADDIEYGKQLGYVVKLLAIAKNTDKGIELRVHPTFVKKEHPLASVSNSFNALNIVGDAVGDVMLYGRGAGALPTGSAIVSDVYHASQFLERNHKYITETKAYKESDYQFVTDFECSYYMRLLVKDKPGVLAKVGAMLSDVDVSITEVIQKAMGEDGNVPLIITTHTTSENKVNKFIDLANASDDVQEVISVMRIEK